jgi:hypothetical protein
MIDLLKFRQLRTMGVAKTPAEAPLGFGHIDAMNGAVRCVAFTDDNPAPGSTMRSEVAGWALPRFGRWRMRAEFMISQFWSQDCVPLWFSASPDPEEVSTIRSTPLCIAIRGDELRIQKRFDPEARAITRENPPGIVMGRAKVLTNKWHSIDIDVNFSYLSDGIVHASLDGRRLAADLGPNAYNDMAAPFPGFGLYSYSMTERDPMDMQFRYFEVS